MDIKEEWLEFKDYLLHRNRYFCNLPILDKIKEYVADNEMLIDSTLILYRAREIAEKDYKDISTADSIIWFEECIKKNPEDRHYLEDKYNDNCKEISDEILLKIRKNRKLGFYGYNAEESSAPPENCVIYHGRANPDLISYLYLSEDANTAITEIRPHIQSSVNVARFKAKHPLKLVNFWYDKTEYGFYKTKEENELAMCLYKIFSSLAKNTYDYYLTQYITEYIKNLGYDGISFKSSLVRHKLNYVIFNPSEFICLDSMVYNVHSIKYESNIILPKGTPLQKARTS